MDTHGAHHHAFGFVVPRFGLFLRIVRLQQSDRLTETNPQGLANVVGVALVLIGSACMVLAAVRHRGYISTVPATDIFRLTILVTRSPWRCSSRSLASFSPPI